MMKYNVRKRNYFFVSAIFCIPFLIYWTLYIAEIASESVHWFLDDFLNVYVRWFSDDAVMFPLFIGLPILVITSVIYLVYYRKEVPVWTSAGIMVSGYIAPLIAEQLQKVIWHIIRGQEGCDIPFFAHCLRFLIILIALAVLAVLVRLIVSMVRYPKKSKKHNDVLNI